MNESRIKNTSRNIIYAVIFQFVKMALIFVGRIIFLKKLGAVYLGINGLFSNILGVLSLADLGMTTALMYSLYEPIAKGDEEAIKKYMNYFKKVYNYIALIIVGFGILLIPFLKYLVNIPAEIENIYLYYILLLINSAISYLFIYKTTLVSADQKAYILNKYDTVFQFILFFGQLFVLLVTNSFALYLIVNIICSLFCNIIKVKKTEDIYPYLKNNDNLQLNKKEKRKIYNNIKSLFLYKIGGVIQSNTDNILISIFVGTIMVGYYSNYSIVIVSITSFLTMVFTSIKASIGNYIIDKDKDEQLNLFNILEVYNFWIIGLCTICFMILLPDFIGICFGEEYILSVGFLICISMNFYTSNIRQTMWIYRETTGLFNRLKYVTLITAVLNLFLSLILGYLFGLIGIVAGTVIARMIYSWWKEPLMLYKHYFKKSVNEYFINYITRLFILFITYFIVNYICNQLVIKNIYVLFAIKSILCLFLVCMVFLIVYIKTPAVKYLKNNILARIINR